MAFGGFDTSREEPMAEMNVIPLVDIMLVLLVIFIITAPVLVHSIKVELPQASSEAAIADEHTLVLSISADEKLFLNDKATNFESLEAEFFQAINEHPELELHLHADHAASYGAIARSMALAQGVGIVRIGFITQPDAAYGNE